MQKSNKRLNIAMVCDPIGSNKSGVVISTLRFGKLLKERGHNVIFISARSKEHKDHSHHYNAKAYRFRSISLPRSGGWYTAFPTVKELKKVFQEEKIDIVHIILPMTATIMAIRAAKALNIKIVAHSHSQPENIFMDMPKAIRPVLDNLWNKYLAWIYGKAESLIYPTEMARNLLDKLSDKNQPSIIISNGIDLKEFQKVDIGDFCQRYEIPSDKIKLLYVGRLFPEKSVDTLIKAIPHIIKKNSNIHVMIVGGGHLRKKLEKLALDLGVRKYVTFLGLVSEKDKIFAYNASDIFILPSLAELEGMVVLEAMACGKPIIVSDAEMSASRYFVDGNGFLFKTQDHEDLAHQVLKLITDANLRKKLGEVSLNKSQHYDIHKSVDLLEKVYSSVVKSKKIMREDIFEDRIYYRTNIFKPDRPTLVFVHGVSGSSSAWLPYEKIFKNKYNVLTFDIRGHGQSKKFPNYSDYEIKEFTNDLHDLITHLNIKKFILISNSFGALIALAYLKSYKETVAMNIFTSPEVYINKGFKANIIRPILKIATGVVSFLPFNPKPRGQVDYSKHINSTDWDIKRNLADMRNTTFRVFFYALRQSFTTDQEYFLEEISAPTLVVHGEKDSMVPLENSVAMSKKIKNSEFVSIPDVDHNTVHNAVKAMSEAIESFLEKNQKNMLV